MSFIKKNSLHQNKNAVGHFREMKPVMQDDLYRLSYYSKEIKEFGVPKTEFFKMISLIQEDERVKIGHELHDGVNPLLALAKLYLEFVTAKTQKEKFAKDQICSVLLSAIENIRTISSQLVISQKMNCSLLQLIQELVDKLKALDIFKISFMHSPESQISKLCPQQKLVLYRILQEQLNNIIKHSKATYVEIKLYCRKEFTNLFVQDNGVGFDTAKMKQGIGLTNIAARINQFNGTMEIKSSPGDGCLLNISLPIT